MELLHRKLGTIQAFKSLPSYFFDRILAFTFTYGIPIRIAMSFCSTQPSCRLHANQIFVFNSHRYIGSKEVAQVKILNFSKYSSPHVVYDTSRYKNIPYSRPVIKVFNNQIIFNAFSLILGNRLMATRCCFISNPILDVRVWSFLTLGQVSMSFTIPPMHMLKLLASVRAISFLHYFALKKYFSKSVQIQTLDPQKPNVLIKKNVYIAFYVAYHKSA